MTREEALNKAINIVAYFEAHFAKSKEAREEAANIIEALEQEPKTGWIPVTERLPEEVKDVLCWYEYFRYGEYDGLYQTYGIGFYWNGSWGGEVSCGKRCRVIAWMPLPEPYKAETE